MEIVYVGKILNTSCVNVTFFLDWILNCGRILRIKRFQFTTVAAKHTCFIHV